MRRIAVPATARHQRGVATIEYALMLMFGLIPLLFVTYTGVMLMAVNQTLSLASAEGARASLRFAPLPERRIAACQAARRSMQWVLAYTAQAPDCSGASTSPILVSAAAPCSGMPDVQCLTVTVSFDYAAHPFLPGTGRLYGWVLDQPIRSTAVAQLDLGSN